MSIVAMSWVMRESEETGGNRLVLLAISDSANDDGTDSWQSVATLARKSRVSERQVQRCLKNLTASGAIVETGRSRAGTHIYTVVMSGDEMSPPEPGVGVTSETPGGDVGVTRSVLEPSIEPPPIVPPSNGVVQIQKRTMVVDRKKATEDEITMAAAILAQWNFRTGQKLTATTWISKIIMRLREHPNTTLDDHVTIMEWALANPWWTDTPFPSVIYGSDAQFERSVAVVGRDTAKPPPLRYGRGMTTKQILDMTQGGTDDDR